MSSEEHHQPNSIEAEQAVIGGLLINAASGHEIEGVFEKLKAEDFFREDHQKIYQAIFTLHSKKLYVDPLTVGEHLNQLKQDKETGGVAYLGELAANAPVSASTLVYAKIVHERALHRSLISVGGEISRLGIEPHGKEISELLDQAENAIFELSKKQIHQKTFASLEPILEEVTLKIADLGNIDSHITGFPTGYTYMDELTSGLQRGDLIIVAGRPSMGKTTLAINIAEFISSHGGDHFHNKTFSGLPCVVGIFSMEMSADQLVMRLISAKGGLPLKSVRSGNLENDEWQDVMRAGEILKEQNSLFIDDSSGISVHTLRGRARHLKREHPNLSLIVIDYLQLLNIDRRLDNRTAEVTEITRILKEMARELNVPVMVLSQLNRAVESRREQRPMMSDLRESGSIEQDADIICFIHRPEVYDRTNDNLKGKSTIFIAKHRNGETGDVNLLFEGQYSRFSNPMRENDNDSFIAAE